MSGEKVRLVKLGKWVIDLQRVQMVENREDTKNYEITMVSGVKPLIPYDVMSYECFENMWYNYHNQLEEWQRIYGLEDDGMIYDENALKGIINSIPPKEGWEINKGCEPIALECGLVLLDVILRDGTCYETYQHVQDWSITGHQSDIIYWRINCV